MINAGRAAGTYHKLFYAIFVFNNEPAWSITRIQEFGKIVIENKLGYQYYKCVIFAIMPLHYAPHAKIGQRLFWIWCRS